MDMTKFEQGDDPGFTAIAGEVRRWVKALSGPSSAQGVNMVALAPQQRETEQGAWCT
jgi:hypothetical protein